MATTVAQVRRLAGTQPPSTSWARRSRSAERVRGWCAGARTSRTRNGRRSPVSPTGVGRSRGGAPRRPPSWSSGSPRPRTAPTAPDGSSPATGRATGCSPRCTASGWPPSRPACTPPTVSTSSTPGWWPRSAAPRRRTSPPPPSATPARPGSRPSSPCCSTTSGWSSRWARSAGTPPSGRSARIGWRVPSPKPRFGHGAEAVLDRRRPRDPPARLLPPQPAEHLHRQAHRADARRRAGPGRRPPMPR